MNSLESYQQDPKIKSIFANLAKRFSKVKRELEEYENWSLYMAYSSYNDKVSNFYTYLTTIHFNRGISLDKIRKRRLKEQNNIYDVEPSYYDERKDIDNSEETQKLLKKLSSEELFVVKSRIWEDKTLEEIAQVLKITKAAVHKKYNNALQKMKYVM